MIDFKPVIAMGLALGLAACATDASAPHQSDYFDAAAAIDLLEALSADEMQGRKVGTAENALARAMIIERLQGLGVQPAVAGFESPFSYGSFADRATGSDTQPEKQGINIIAQIDGTSDSDLSMIITAHYDHVGVIDGEVYNGADDNASGVVGLIAVAEFFAQNPPNNNITLIAFDAEEDGLGGSIAYVANPHAPLDRVALNLNFDMLSRGDNGKLWASGTAHWPEMVPIVTEIADRAEVQIEMGFDQGNDREDWTLLSDHAAFYRAGIPHLYFGVEDHPDYHKPGDDFEKIDQTWFVDSVDSVIMTAIAMDTRLPEIYAMRQTAAE